MARVWVSVETRYPVQFEGERVYDQTRHTYRPEDQFQWDMELDRGLSSPTFRRVTSTYRRIDARTYTAVTGRAIGPGLFHAPVGNFIIMALLRRAII